MASAEMSEFQDLLQEQLKDPNFKKEWDLLQKEINANNLFSNDTMHGLLEAVAIEEGKIPVKKVDGLAATTFRKE